MLLNLAQAKARLELYEQKARDDDFTRHDVKYSEWASLAVLYSEDEDAFAYMWGDRFVDGYVALQAIMSFEEVSR